MEVNPDLVIFVMKENLEERQYVKATFQVKQLTVPYLFVEILKVHEKEAKNNNNRHKVGNTR
jgi:hypothetical protein